MKNDLPHPSQLLSAYTVQNFDKRVGFVLSGSERVRVPDCHGGVSGEGLFWAILSTAPSPYLGPSPFFLRKTAPVEDLSALFY